MNFLRMISFALVLAILLSLLSIAALAREASDLTSLFDEYTEKDGSFTLSKTARIYVVQSDEPRGNLRKTLELATSRMAAASLPDETALDIAYGSQTGIREGDIVLLRDDTLPEEGYHIEISEKNLEIYYAAGKCRTYYGGESSYNGLHYAFNALLRLFDSDRVGCCSFTDAPDTAERTVQLDIGRKYWSMEWIKNLIDEMSWMGYNALDLHLTEDQGIRANIWEDAEGNTVPDCNGNDFGWLIGYHKVSWNTDYTDPNAEQYYTRDELVEIVEYAKSRHIEIIPAVDFPTHADCLIAKFKSNFVDTASDFSFFYDGNTYRGHDGLQGGNKATIDVTDEYARSLTFAVTEAYAAFFASFGCTSFNIGGDEVSGASDSWATSDYNRTNGGFTCKDAYVIYMNQLSANLKEHGYRVRAWNDCLFGTGFYSYDANGNQRILTEPATVRVDPAIEVCFWTADTSHTSPSTLAAEGRTVYNCVNWFTYYALRNNSTFGDARDAENLQWTFNHATPERIYSGCQSACAYSCRHTEGWNPSDFGGCMGCFTDEFVTGEQLGGGYFLIWGDWAGWDTEENIWNRNDSYNLIDRIWANAVKQWDWDADKTVDYPSFAASVEAFRYFPGYQGCTQAASCPSGGRILKNEAKIQVKTMVNGGEVLLDTLAVEGIYGESYRVRLPQYLGFPLGRAENGAYTFSVPSRGCGTVSGTVGQTTTVWLWNDPDLRLLAIVMQGNAAAEAFYEKVAVAPSIKTTQTEINEWIERLLIS